MDYDDSLGGLDVPFADEAVRRLIELAASAPEPPAPWSW